MGCFLKGCLVVALVFGILGFAFSWSVYYFMHEARSFMSDRPVAIRIAPATPAQYQAVYDRYRQFAETLARGDGATLSLSADDLNTLIARDPAVKDLRGKVYLEIQGDELTAETCFPLPKNDNPFMSSPAQYFGGKIRLAASYSSGEFTFAIREIRKMDGQPAPPLVNRLVGNMGVSDFFNRNVNDYVRDQTDRNPTSSAILARVRTIIIQNQQVVITADPGPPLQLATPVASPSAPE